jgi:hypothetical protein
MIFHPQDLNGVQIQIKSALRISLPNVCTWSRSAPEARGWHPDQFVQTVPAPMLECTGRGFQLFYHQSPVLRTGLRDLVNGELDERSINPLLGSSRSV